MNASEFKTHVNEAMGGTGFVKKGNTYYRRFKDITISIYLQKSNYSNAFYICIGYIIHRLQADPATIRHVDGDIRGRFTHNSDGTAVELFDLDKLEGDIKGILSNNIKKLIESISTLDDLRHLLIANPYMLYLTTIRAKALLGFSSN